MFTENGLLDRAKEVSVVKNTWEATSKEDSAMNSPGPLGTHCPHIDILRMLL